MDAVAEESDPHIAIAIASTEAAIEVFVQDNGVGIPESQRDQVFEPRFTSKSGGTGLGLTITRSIVSQLNGRIEVDQGYADGARFRIVFKKT